LFFGVPNVGFSVGPWYKYLFFRSSWGRRRCFKATNSRISRWKWSFERRNCSIEHRTKQISRKIWAQSGTGRQPGSPL